MSRAYFRLSIEDTLFYKYAAKTPMANSQVNGRRIKINDFGINDL